MSLRAPFGIRADHWPERAVTTEPCVAARGTLLHAKGTARRDFARDSGSSSESSCRLALTEQQDPHKVALRLCRSSSSIALLRRLPLHRSAADPAATPAAMKPRRGQSGTAPIVSIKPWIEVRSHFSPALYGFNPRVRLLTLPLGRGLRPTFALGGHVCSPWLTPRAWACCSPRPRSQVRVARGYP